MVTFRETAFLEIQKRNIRIIINMNKDKIKQNVETHAPHPEKGILKEPKKMEKDVKKNLRSQGLRQNHVNLKDKVVENDKKTIEHKQNLKRRQNNFENVPKSKSAKKLQNNHKVLEKEKPLLQNKSELHVKKMDEIKDKKSIKELDHQLNKKPHKSLNASRTRANPEKNQINKEKSKIKQRDSLQKLERKQLLQNVQIENQKKVQKIEKDGEKRQLIHDGKLQNGKHVKFVDEQILRETLNEKQFNQIADINRKGDEKLLIVQGKGIKPNHNDTDIKIKDEMICGENCEKNLTQQKPKLLHNEKIAPQIKQVKQVQKKQQKKNIEQKAPHENLEKNHLDLHESRQRKQRKPLWAPKQIHKQKEQHLNNVEDKNQLLERGWNLQKKHVLHRQPEQKNLERNKVEKVKENKSLDKSPKDILPSKNEQQNKSAVFFKQQKDLKAQAKGGKKQLIKTPKSQKKIEKHHQIHHRTNATIPLGQKN